MIVDMACHGGDLVLASQYLMGVSGHFEPG